MKEAIYFSVGLSPFAAMTREEAVELAEFLAERGWVEHADEIYAVVDAGPTVTEDGVSRGGCAECRCHHVYAEHDLGLACQASMGVGQGCDCSRFTGSPS